MGIALVGSAGAIAVTATTSVTSSFGQATTAGHLLIARIGADASGTIATTASGWSPALAFTGGAAIFYKPNCGAGETAPTFTATGATVMAADLSEWSGAATSSPVDKTHNGSGLNSAPDSAADDLCVACLFDTSSKSTTFTVTNTWSPSGGTVVADQNTGATKQALCFVGSAYLLNGHGGLVADQDAIAVTPGSGTTLGFGIVIASFLAATAATPIAPFNNFLNNAVRRASYWFSRVPWHERKGGLLVPAQRKLIVV